MSTQRLIQITDCHLGGEPGEKLLGLNTDESLNDVLSLVQSEESSIDQVVISGDVASYGQIGAYRRFPSLIGRYVQAPLAWLAGNHDSDPLMRQTANEVIMDHLILGAWQVILLNSSVTGFEHGDLQESELQRLQQLLEEHSQHALVFVHHQPVPVGSTWIDQYVIRNGDRLMKLLSAYRQVKALVFGHIHQEFTVSGGAFQLLATPSTCIQFKPGSPDFALDDCMPGYRWFDLHDDGQFESGVRRIKHRHYDIDYSSDGY